ncbi:MAG: 4Fe-4S dicluster domain-containing protein [Acidobacteriota bacterium]
MRRVFANPDLCTGCRLCATACATVKLGVASWRKGAIIVRQDLFERYEFQSLCRHCDPAPCMDACMTGCIERYAGGVVRLDSTRCVGCWMCVMVCPYDAIARDLETQVARKCDLCAGREAPACVAICPTEALMCVETPESPCDGQSESVSQSPA